MLHSLKLLNIFNVIGVPDSRGILHLGVDYRKVSRPSFAGSHIHHMDITTNTFYFKFLATVCTF